VIGDHIPNKGEQLVRYFGWYSNNNSRSMRNKELMATAGPTTQHKSVTLEDSSMVPPGIPSTLPIAKLVVACGLNSSKKSISYPHWFVPSAVCLGKIPLRSATSK
jgi:hypothetical protein